MDLNLLFNGLNFVATASIAGIGGFIARSDRKKEQDFKPFFYVTEMDEDKCVGIGVANNSSTNAMILRNMYKDPGLNNYVKGTSYKKRFLNDVIIDKQSHSEILSINYSQLMGNLNNGDQEWLFQDMITDKKWKIVLYNDDENKNIVLLKFNEV